MTNIFGTEHAAEHIKQTGYPAGDQYKFQFANGYGASVIRNSMSYGGSSGLWELAVLKKAGDRWPLTYDTPITDDVLGHLSEAEVAETLKAVEALPQAGA